MGQKERFYVDIMALQPEVTGSCNLVIVKYPNKETTKFIVDCGLFQEKEYLEYNKSLPFDCDDLKFVLVTHNHTDHVGRLPLLDKNIFQGKVYMTKQTKCLLPLSLYDSCKVLKDLAKRNHTQNLYSEENVSSILERTVGCDYEETFYVDKNVKVTLFKNGHLVGAAMILVQIAYPGCEDINILFTGDYNNKNIFFDVPSLPKWVLDLPLTIVQESTYGYMDSSDINPVIESNIVDCLQQRKKTAICFVFSLGRCQEVLHLLRNMQETGRISTDIPIYLDGKLAIKYTELYKNAELGFKTGMNEFLPVNLTYVDRDSRPSLVEDSTPKVIVTTSGMGTYGPAQFYIPAYIGKEGCLLQFTGYTAEGTVGRQLKDTPLGEIITTGGLVKRKLAFVEYSSELSAHAKADEMLDFLKKFNNLKLVLVNHGEQKSKEIFSSKVEREIKTKDVAILGRDYLYRISPYGLIRSLSTSYR